MQRSTLKNKLSFLRKQSNTFAKDEPRRNTENVKTGALERNPDAKRRGTMAAYDIPNKVVKNTEGYYDKKGWILKKATSSYLGMANWQRRYLILKNDKLMFYDGDTPQDLLKPKKTVDMKNVKCVCSHYDPYAPIKSQKLAKGAKNDRSRFDIYAPGRVFNLKSEFEDFENSDEWLAVL